jgi:hypothetical protein
MAKRKKIYNYEFADCNQTLPSSVAVRCSISGEIVKMYHKQLVKLVQTKYKNRWELFKLTYAKKGSREKPKSNEDGEYNTTPELYRKYLITTFLSYKRDKTMSEEERASKLRFISTCYANRWKASIETVINAAAL